MSTRTRSSTARGTTTNPAASRITRTNHENKNQTKAIYCLCRGPDDGSPMVHCAYCKEWYHFRCVDLEEETAHDLDMFICPPCTQRTGHKSVMTWEGPDGYESPAITTTQTKQKSAPRAQKKPRKRIKKEDDDPAEELPSESPESSDDEYVDVGKAKRSRKTLTYESDSDSDNPPASSHLKRKASAPDKKPTKRKKSLSVENELDPARKYCLSKLDELFTQIFLRYPPDEEGEEELLKAKASQFATELEASVFTTYAEPDKHKNPSVGQKYKARFNTLQFNLSKDDRVSLHKGIASGGISPAELAVMSPADLANEQMRQSIQIAEKEALEHSILKKTKVPTAKITHKGLENIEDQGGLLISERNAELEREQAEEERRERERLMRIKSAEEHQRQRAPSMSLPPESPIVPHQAWGAPSAASPQSAEVPGSPTVGLMRPPTNPLFVHTASEQARELELSLDDIIHVEEATPEGLQSASSVPAAPQSSESLSPIAPPAPSFEEAPAPPTASEGPSFSLDSLWNAPLPAPESSSPPPSTATVDVVPSDSQTAADHDFDMFLEDKPENITPPPLKTPSMERFQSSPRVWSGIISMPLDSSIPQDTQVIARQAGGRSLAPDAPHWKVLFPSGTLRIDGRVPVENSSKFLVQMRLNPSKEMISVAFSPAIESAADGFKTMSDFLINKNRHGLIFPWGNRPKEHHPGRELYIIPLLSSEPLPECIELLDDLKLPKERTEDYFVGIWIVGRGKLDAAAEAAAAPPLPPAALLSHIPTVPLTHVPTPPPPGLGIAQPPFTPIQPTAPRVAPAALAAEVASLTPDQIQAMLQMLAATNVGQTISPPPLQHPPPPGQSPTQPSQWQPPPPPVQPHQPTPPGFYGQPSHPHYAMYPPPPHETQHYPPPGPGHMSPWDHPGHARGGGYGDKGDRSGGRGRGGGRGGGGRGRRPDGRGGREGGHNGGRGGNRTQDSGWPKRKGLDNY